MSEDDTLTIGLASDAVPAESEKSEEAAKGKPAAATETETDTEADAGAPEPEGDDGEGDDDDKPKRSRSGSQKLKRQVQRLESELAALRSQAPVGLDAKDLAAAVEREVGDAPKEADYADWFDFQNAKAAYEAEKRLVARELRNHANTAEAQRATRNREVLEDFRERTADAAKAIPDFKTVLASAADIPVAPFVGELILESEKGPLLQYHLAKNPADLERLNGLSPLAAAKEIGRLEARLSLAKPNTATRASPPVPALKGSSAPRVSDISKMSMDEYVKFRQRGK